MSILSKPAPLADSSNILPDVIQSDSPEYSIQEKTLRIDLDVMEIEMEDSLPPLLEDSTDYHVACIKKLITKVKQYRSKIEALKSEKRKFVNIVKRLSLFVHFILIWLLA